MKFDSEKLAANIRGMRGKADISQVLLADMVGVNVTTIVKYEDGTMTPGTDKLFAMAEALGCTPNDLLGWS